MAGTLRALLLAVLLVTVVPASAKDYAVGDSSGWRTGVDYTAWAKGKTFSVGDTLSFQYNAVHSVEEVSAADYGACSASNPLRSYRDQSTSIPLTKTGTRYFICGTTGHCASGMKLTVTVSGGGSPATSGPVVRSNTTPADDATTAAPVSSSRSNSSTNGAAGSGARLATGLLFGAVGLAALMG
ncbi:mavicyanin-like [Phragmites australis]|uniref:mavicyanin-like n=1 Tax=Phragmites australis TaxID=29695 RepID=UPI002D7711F7|nr:mavicyanin-like [Phragmites australis]